MIFLEIVLHLDKYLADWTQTYGVWVYAISFLVVFCETGLVVMPFLPGDSLLFVLGSLTVVESSPLNIPLLSAVLIVATFLGDNCNYLIGRKAGIQIFSNPASRFLNPVNLKRTQDFYSKYGVRAVIMARFVPLIRTFVPFVAGVGKMEQRKFLGYSALGSLLWTQTFLWSGAAFGNLPSVKKNFEIVILAVIAISLMPGALAFAKAYIQKRQAKA